MPELLAHSLPIWYLASAHVVVALFKAGACAVYGMLLRRWLNAEVNLAALVASRTLLGILLGLICLAWSLCVDASGSYWGQAPLRIILWWFIIWRFFPATDAKVEPTQAALAESSRSAGPQREPAWRRPVAILVGVGVSYLTDIPVLGSAYVY